MSYIKNDNFKDGNVLNASDLIAMEDAIINLESNTTNASYINMSNEFKLMVQPGFIDYSNGGNSGTTASFINQTTSTQSHKCGVGHAIYLCNRTFIFSNSNSYEMVIIKLDKDLKIIENSGWVSGTYTIEKGSCAWFSIILRSADSTSVANNLSDVVENLNVLVSKEDIDKNSDFPLILGIMDFTSNGVMNSNTVFTTYSKFNTLSLVYPIVNEKMIEQTVRKEGWRQSLITYDIETGAKMQKPVFSYAMTWVDTMDGENFFPQWRKTNSGTISYDEAIEISKKISLKVVDNKSHTTWVMHKNHPFRASSHRIEAELAPRNTYSALIFAYNRGRRWFESDIRWTKDGVAVMLHDDNISSVSNGNVSISSINYEQALAYDFGNYHAPKFKGEKILRLEDMMRFALEHDCGLNLEFKTSTNKETAQKVWDMVKKYNLEKQVIFNINGLNASFMTSLLEIDKTIELQVLVTPSTANIDTLAGFLNGENKISLCNTWSTWTESLVEYARSKGIKSNAHCVSSEDVITPTIYKQMIDWGLNGIITETANLSFYSDELMPKR